MKRLLIALAAVAALAIPALATAAPAMATTDQQMVDLTGIPIDVGSLAPCLPYDLVITGNGHDHFFSNNNGFWENATVEGVGVAGPYTGKGEAWFTFNDNNRNVVSTFKAMLQLTQGTKIQMTGTFVVNANGVPVVNNATTTCS
jgi:hypothetical protein